MDNPYPPDTFEHAMYVALIEVRRIHTDGGHYCEDQYWIHPTNWPCPTRAALPDHGVYGAHF